MAPSSAAIDWDMLKPQVLRLLSEGKKRQEVVEEISKDGTNITLGQLDYQLKGWGKRMKLTANAWKHISYKVGKRTRDRKSSAVFFDGVRIPPAKVDKETRRYDRPTLLPAPGASPPCPEDLDLMVCTPPTTADSPVRKVSPEVQHILLSTRPVAPLPWLIFCHELQQNFALASVGGERSILLLTRDKSPRTFQFPATLNVSVKLQKPSLGVQQLYQRSLTSSESTESDQLVQRGDAVPDRWTPGDPHIATDFERLIFEISNKISAGCTSDEEKLWASLADRLKTVARSSSRWKSLLSNGQGATPRALIEQLFKFSIRHSDETLADLMLQIGADPNQKVLGNTSALYYAVGRSKSIVALLLSSGAVCTQVTLMRAIVAGEFDIADLMLQSNSSLDLNFNYHDICSNFGVLKVETVTLLALMSWSNTVGYDDDKLRYLLDRKAAITLETMILAAHGADAATLRFLMENGGDVRGTNRFGFSCLAAASSKRDLQYDVFEFLLRSGAPIDIPQTHHAFGSLGSPIHWLCSRRLASVKFYKEQLLRLVSLLIDSGGNINYRIRHLGSPYELDEAHERFLWSEHSQSFDAPDDIIQAKVETPLEYAIIAGNEEVALELIKRGCQLTGRELKLAVKFGLLSLLKELRNYGRWHLDGGILGRTCLQLALRWRHRKILDFLLGDGVKLGQHNLNIMDALQYPGTSALPVRTQVDLIHATQDLNRRRIFGLPLLEVCCLKFSAVAVREILRIYPTAYGSGALAATVLRALMHEDDPYDDSDFQITDIEAMKSRRTENNCEWDKENMALLAAAVFGRPEILRILVAPDTACMMKAARISKDDLSHIMDQKYGAPFYYTRGPTHFLTCQDWVTCSPLMGIAAMALTPPATQCVNGAPLVSEEDMIGFEDRFVSEDMSDSEDMSVSEDMLDHLLACSYEPDVLTVVVAATRDNLRLLRRVQHLDNWRSIMSVDNPDRPPWFPTALQVAVLDGNEKLVQFLLDAGVSLNEKPASEPMGRRMPRTALQAAIDKKNQRLTELFIEQGADVDAPAAEDSGATALQLACIHGDLDLSLRLLELGADVNAGGALRHGRTALQGAAEHGRIDTIQLLLNHGACTDGPYRLQYVKAVVYAEKNQHFAAAGLLREHREWSAEDEECYKTIQADKLCDE